MVKRLRYSFFLTMEDELGDISTNVPICQVHFITYCAFVK